MKTTVGRLGEIFLARTVQTWRMMPVLAGLLMLSILPGSWKRTVRDVLGRQILFTGVDALPLTVMAGFLAGVAIVAQAQAWLQRFGQSESLGYLLVVILVREVGPLIVNLILLGRSGTAMAAELASMTVRREVYALEVQGVDPMVYLMLPRVMSVMISSLCLSVCFTVVALASGYLFAAVAMVTGVEPLAFFRAVLKALGPWDVFSFLAKTLIPGFLIGFLSCRAGMLAGSSATEIPKAVTRAVVSAIVAVLVTSTIVSVLVPL